MSLTVGTLLLQICLKASFSYLVGLEVSLHLLLKYVYAPLPAAKALTRLVCVGISEPWLLSDVIRVGIKPGFYHKAQPAGFYGFYEGGFWGFMGFMWVL